MNYSKIYFNIVERRKQSPYDGYVEKHHIVPKSLGGSDDKENLVALSAREHFIAHLLLTKMYSEGTPEYFKMIKSFMMMLTCKSNNQNRLINSKKYECLRIEFSKVQSLSQKGRNNSQFGKPKSEELKTKISQSVSKTLSLKGLGNKKKVKLERAEKNKIKRQKNIDLYREYYILYKKVGFETFVELTGYDKSKPNLVQRFKKLLPEFKPQNGKKRGQ
jgi:hypothetical protein